MSPTYSDFLGLVLAASNIGIIGVFFVVLGSTLSLVKNKYIGNNNIRIGYVIFSMRTRMGLGVMCAKGRSRLVPQ